MNDPERLPHASLCAEDRLRKARRIVLFLQRYIDASGGACRVLEIGTGAGALAYHCSQTLGPGGHVEAVDVRDHRVFREGYDFRVIEGTRLPFETASFDLVISNHVIEHVGAHSDQMMHLREMSRVLRTTGVGYLAVPSRWQVIEPHYGVALLSWLPRRFRTRYLRLRGLGSFYDCEPLSMRQLERMLHFAGVKYRNCFADVLSAIAEHEVARGGMVSVLSRLPPNVLMGLRALSPTHVYLFAHQSDVMRSN